MVTGSSGFIGSHLVRALLRRRWEVRCLTRSASSPEASGDAVAGAGRSAEPRAQRYLVDYAEPRTLAATPALDGVTHVFHLAGVTRARSEDEFRRGNILPAESLLGALEARRAPLQRFLHVSSQAAAGPAPSLDHPTVESAPLLPIEAYGRSKADAEGVVHRYSRTLPCTIIRPPAVYGPADRGFLALFRLLRWRLSLHPGRRDAYLSMIFVDDLVEGMIEAALSPAANGGTYFLAHPEPVEWGELHRAVAALEEGRTVKLDVPHFAVAGLGRIGDLYGRLTGRPPLLTSQKARLGRPRFWVCSAERARAAFGFEAPTSLESGLAATHRWYRAQGWLH